MSARSPISSSSFLARASGLAAIYPVLGLGRRLGRLYVSDRDRRPFDRKPR